MKKSANQLNTAHHTNHNSKTYIMLSFVKNRKGGSNLLDQAGYEYRLRRAIPAKDRTYWHCVANRLKSCPATAITVTSNNTLVKQEGEHTHSNDNIERKVKTVVKTAVESAAMLPTVTPRTILGSIAVNLETNLPGTTKFIPNRNTVSQAVNRARRTVKGHPPKPQHFDDLIDLPVSFTR